MADVLQVVTTIDSREAADDLARAVIEARVAACAQVDGPVSSTYWWEGRAETEEEWRVTIKTAADRYRDLAETLTSRHPYDTPEILASPVTHGHEEYLAWVIDETRQAGG